METECVVDCAEYEDGYCIRSQKPLVLFLNGGGGRRLNALALLECFSNIAVLLELFYLRDAFDGSRVCPVTVLSVYQLRSCTFNRVLLFVSMINELIVIRR